MSFSIRTSIRQQSASKSRKIILVVLILLSLFLVGTIIVLSGVSYYFGIPTVAYLTEDEVPWRSGDAIRPLIYEPLGSAIHHKRQEGVVGEAAIREGWAEIEEELGLGPTEGVEVEDAALVEVSGGEWDVDGQGSGGYWMKKDWNGHVEGTHEWDRLLNVTTLHGENIPRMIHQTWKDDNLPNKWRKAWKECREGMPDYEYMLWTDDTSREFIKQHYPAHLHMYDSYKYPIQRADSIRYFVLHHFGGIYMDLDIGCRRRLDTLLQGDWDTILPITKPVGVSNDLIFSAKGSTFMDDTVHALPAWNHEWVSNYPTVMFSTGPMFLSGQYATYSSAHPLTEDHPRAEVRILPKSLYGKNAPEPSVPHSFFSHFYGSSWHADDAGFITFLGAWGKKLMYVGAVVVLIGIARLVYSKMFGPSTRYQSLTALPTSASTGSTTSSPTASPISTDSSFFSSGFEPTSSQKLPSDIASAFRRAGNLILAAPTTLLSGDRRTGRRRTNLLYFVPAMFQPGAIPRTRGRTASEASQLPLRRPRREREQAPPSYERVSSDRAIEAASALPGKKVDGEGMEEVDAFLRETQGVSASKYDHNGSNRRERKERR